MGWASGTDIFDGAVDVALSFTQANSYDEGVKDHITRIVVEKMYTGVDWGDWDTQDESKYFEPYLESVMRELGELDEDY